MKSIRELSRRLSTAIIRVDGIEKSSDANDSERLFILALDDGLPHSQRQIADELEISRTTLNTIVKKWEKQGLLTLNKIPGKRREKEICLTELGIERAKATIENAYSAEDTALKETIKMYSENFVEALEFYANALKAEYDSKKKPKKRLRKIKSHE